MRPNQIRLIQSVFASQRGGWQWLLFYLLPPLEGAGYTGLMLKILSSP